MRYVFLIIVFIIVRLFLDISDVCAQQFNTDTFGTEEVQDSERISDTGFYRFYTHFGAGSPELPFWLYANRHGLVRSGSTVNIFTGFASETALTRDDSHFDVRFGGELVNRFSDQDNTLHFQQLYGSLQYGKMRLRAGRFYRLNDFDRALEGITTGFFVESHNATPYPRISLETDGFIEVPGTGGELLMRFRYSDGILESDRHISSPLLHQKSLQFRAVFNRLSVQIGVFHSVMWAGVDEERGRLPRGFNDYMRVVFSRPASEESAASESEMINRIGNTIGTYEAGFEYRADRFRLVGYRHLFLEDELSVRFQSPWDGIWGFGVIRNEGDRPFRAIVYEHLNSIRQESRKGLAQGRASFYNHGIYTDGWSYQGRLMGNPLYTFDPKNRYVFNNVMIAHHLGAIGNLSNRFSYRTKLTYSRNYGVCEDQVISGRCNIMPGDPIPDNLELRSRSELRKDRISGLLELNFLLIPDQNLHLHTTFAADAGKFFGRRIGVMAGISISK